MSNLRISKNAKNILKKRIALFATVAVLTAGGITVINALDKPDKVVPEGYSTLYTSYEIGPGETLWSIASDNLDRSGYEDVRDYINEIIQINHLDPDQIKSGQNIIISYIEEVKQK